jgi:hypothetical protein
MSKPDPNAPACPHCGKTMTHRTIPHLGGLPDRHSGGLPEILIFYCAPCEHVEAIKEKRAA